MGTITETKHTPTPWKIDEEYILHDETTVGQLWAEGSWSPVPGTSIPTFDEMQANAAFIVKAVNVHDELVYALESAKKIIDYLAEHEGRFFDDFDSEMGLQGRINAALTKAQ